MSSICPRWGAYGDNDSIGNQGFEGNRHRDRWQSALEVTVSDKRELVEGLASVRLTLTLCRSASRVEEQRWYGFW